MKKIPFLLFVVAIALTMSCYHYVDVDDTAEIGFAEPEVTVTCNSAEIIIKPYVISQRYASGLPKDLLVKVYYSSDENEDESSFLYTSTTRDSNNHYVATLSHLSDTTRYFFKVKAHTLLFDAHSESDIYEFTTLTAKPYILSPTTVTNVTDISAFFSSSIIDAGCMDLDYYGFCWSKNPEPTLNNCDRYILLSVLQDFTFDAFYLLDPSTTYYVRSFVKTTKDTYYGEVTSFTTLAE